MSAPLLQELQRAPYEFEFFQAVRVLQQLSRSSDNEGTQAPVGEDFSPQAECVRFRVVPSLGFPASEITAFEPGTEVVRDDRVVRTPPTLTINFTGLTGPLGVLPRHYTQLLIDQQRLKEHALRDFLDLFHHRVISLFYRAWQKYHFPVAFEQALLRAPRTEDPFTHALHCLTGLGGQQVRNRLAFSDWTYLYYGALFAQRPPNQVSLERMIEECFEIPAAVQQFEGQWLYLDPADQTRLRMPGQALGYNTQLGATALVGERVWNVENRFTVELGPLSYAQFQRLAPAGDRRAALDDFIRMYVGIEYDVDTRLVLRKDEVPCVQLSSTAPDEPRLGWNTWIYNQPPLQDARDAAFHVTGVSA